MQNETEKQAKGPQILNHSNGSQQMNNEQAPDRLQTSWYF